MSEGIFLYQGATKRTVRWFRKAGFPCPEHINPPDYFMRLLYIEDRKAMNEKEKDILNILSRYYQGHEHLHFEEHEIELNLMDLNYKFEKTTCFAQFRVVLARSLLNVKRQPMLSAVKIIQAIFLSVLLITIFHNNGSDPRSIQNFQGILFANQMSFISLAMQAQALTFPLDRPVFLKEYKEDLYGVTPFFLAKIISEFPFQVIFITLYTCIIYFVIPYNTSSASKFFIYYGIALASQVAGNAIGYCIGSVTNNVAFAITIGPLTMMTMVVYGGFFSNTDSLASAFYWMKYISPFNYGYRALILNQFTDYQFEEGVQNPIDRLNFQGEIWENAGCLLLVGLGYLLAAGVILKISGEYHKKNN